MIMIHSSVLVSVIVIAVFGSNNTYAFQNVAVMPSSASQRSTSLSSNSFLIRLGATIDDTNTNTDSQESTTSTPTPMIKDMTTSSSTSQQPPQYTSSRDIPTFMKREFENENEEECLIPHQMNSNIYNFNKFVVDTVYQIICILYPVKGTQRDFARFYVLETVARVPYFAYLTVMHLRETFGERQHEKMRTHYAEADNELHHLLIMESLGGNSTAIDRTVATTMAFGYYWYVLLIYSWNEAAAYHLSELIEDHAYHTYNDYLHNYKELLENQPVPEVARQYYMEENPFLFDLFCTVKYKDSQGNFSTRRPILNSLYDVFLNVRDDEKEHWKTLCNLVQYNDMHGSSNCQVQSTQPMEVVTTSSTN